MSVDPVWHPPCFCDAGKSSSSKRMRASVNVKQGRIAARASYVFLFLSVVALVMTAYIVLFS